MAIDTDSSSITMVDGRQAAIQWGRAGVHALHATVYQPLVNWADDQGDIVIDFDVGRSFVPADDLGIDADFVFLPHIRAVNARATATIDGTVRDGAGPAPGAIVYAHRIFGEEAVVLAATAHAGTDGRYTLAFLDAGDYLIEARRAARGAVSAFAPVVTVLMGDRRTVDLALPGDSAGPALVVWGPSLIAVGDTVLFHARAVDAQGDSVASPSVGWTSGNAAAAGVIGEGAAPRVAGRAVGSSWIVGRWNGMGDSVLLNVAASTDTTGYR
jgi:hypothetical protein